MSTESKILNRICRLLHYGTYRKFLSPCSVRKIQARYLKRLLRKNGRTVYGQRYGFQNIKNYEDFATKVPLTVYEDYEPYIRAMETGAKAVLTKEKIRLFELTSGSSGGRKLIPYTSSLKREFGRGIKPWLCDIYTRVEGVEEGKSYWSITPVTSARSYTPCGIPVGFEEDAEYFGLIERGIMKRLFAVDGSVKFVSDLQDFYTRTARQLLTCDCLTLISVWSPTFLTLLCDFMREHRNSLAGNLDESRRMLFLEAAAANRFDRIFPNLKIISCWAEGSAASHIDTVRRYFPGVSIQPKGLLATECFASFPLVGEEGARLSIYSHFFEFRRPTDGRIFTADQISEGEYELIVTTGGGLYRYCIGDIVEVLQVYPDAPPRLRFLRRSGTCSDLSGEKLTEEFVRSVCKQLGIAHEFCLLAPEGNRYCLYTTVRHITSEMLDAVLCESYHYDYCRRLGQLAQAQVIPVASDARKAYMERLAGEGMRLGDIKPAYLSTQSGWANYLRKEP